MANSFYDQFMPPNSVKTGFYRCDNDQCEYHQKISKADYYITHFQVTKYPPMKMSDMGDANTPLNAPFKATIVQRHLLKQGYETYFLCDACLTVLQPDDPNLNPNP